MSCDGGTFPSPLGSVKAAKGNTAADISASRSQLSPGSRDQTITLDAPFLYGVGERNILPDLLASVFQNNDLQMGL